MTALTPKMLKCFQFIEAYILEHRVSPKLKEIAAHMGLSGRNSAKRLVDELEDRGLVRRDPMRARNIEIVQPRGADFHLARILEVVEQDGIIGLTSPLVAEAREFMGRAA
nr:MAG TPA: LexA repressor [Caudoviricetes sp.]